jgi:beta-phosphoglucomutase-like phosphatase (HAD superfamily)
MRIQGIAAASRPVFIFDIDGTIIDSMPAHNASWADFFARHGVTIDPADFFARSAGRTGVEAMREFLGAMSDERARALVTEKEALYRARFGPVFREVAGFAAFAREARRCGIRLACATAGDADNIAFALAHLGMQDFFDAVVGGHEVAHGKPEPDIFLLAARRIGVAAVDCVVFEDAPFGIEGARRAGMLAVALTTGTSAEALSGPHVLAAIADYRDITPGQIAAIVHARALRTGTEA